MKIGVNCGHTVSGQPGCGAVGFIDESVETRNVGKHLTELLKKGGHTVVNCTNDYAGTTSENLKKIVSKANAQALDLFVSIHFNAGGGKGTEVYTYGGQNISEAVNTVKAISGLGFTNRGIKDGSHLYVIRHTYSKSMLIEVCFVDTADAEKYKAIGCQKIAQAIYSAITGGKVIEEYTRTNDIIWELQHRGIISNSDMWIKKSEKDTNIYWLLRKICHYIRTKKSKENERQMYTKPQYIAWDLWHRGIISSVEYWRGRMQSDSNIYWLAKKALDYIRTH